MDSPCPALIWWKFTKIRKNWAEKTLNCRQDSRVFNPYQHGSATSMWGSSDSECKRWNFWCCLTSTNSGLSARQVWLETPALQFTAFSRNVYPCFGSSLWELDYFTIEFDFLMPWDTEKSVNVLFASLFRSFGEKTSTSNSTRTSYRPRHNARFEIFLIYSRLLCLL